MGDDEAGKKLAALQKENLYLKSLLDAHGIAYQAPKSVPQIKLSTDEKIALFLSYFRGRDDIFAERYETKDGKSGYAPLCLNKFDPFLCGLLKKTPCRLCPNRRYRGLTDGDFHDHLSGKRSLGIYPLIDGDFCYFLALDFDEGNFFENAQQYRLAAARHGFDCGVEISRSGKGAHCWLFFESLTKAAVARKIGDVLLQEAMDTAKGISFEAFDRFFPSQDYLTKEGYGNLIALPDQGERAKEGCSVFVDENGVPYPSQSSFLLSLRKIKREEVALFLSWIKENGSDPLKKGSYRSNRPPKKTDFPAGLTLIRKGDLFVPKASISESGLVYLKRLANIPNHEFYQKEQCRVSTYRIPRVLQLAKENDQFLMLPRGVYDDIVDSFALSGISLSISDERYKGKPIDADFTGNLYPEQEEALSVLLKKDNGLLVAPTAFGKTVTAIALIARLKVNTLILVHNRNLLSQWQEKLNQFLQVHYSYQKEKDKFGTFHGNKKKLTGSIDVASLSSFDETPEKEAILSSYGLVLIDEVHHIGAVSFEKVVRASAAQRIYGLTATPKRSDGNESVIFKSIGPILWEAKKKDILPFSKILVPRFSDFHLKESDTLLPYVEQCDLLYQDEKRNQLLVDDVKEAYRQKKSILVLSGRVDHLELLKDKILSFCPDVFLLHGGMKPTEKKAVLARIQAQRDPGFILLSTGQYVGEGFDNNLLDTLFVAMPFKWRGTLAQYVGRLHRLSPLKKEVKVYDYVDIQVVMFSHMFAERLRGYKSQGYIPLEPTEGLLNRILPRAHYEDQFREDLRRARYSVIVFAPSYDENLLTSFLQETTAKVILYSPQAPLLLSKINYYSQDTTAFFMIIDSLIVFFSGSCPFASSVFFSPLFRLQDGRCANDILHQVVDKSTAKPL